MPINISDGDVARAVSSIRRYASESLDTDVGDLQARLLLDYLLKEIGPLIYNGAIADAQTYMRDRVVDLESLCVEPAFAYWPKSAVRRKSD